MDINALLDQLESAPTAPATAAATEAATTSGAADGGGAKRPRRSSPAPPPITTGQQAALDNEAKLEAPRVLVVCAAGPDSLALQLYSPWGEHGVDIALLWYGPAESLPVLPEARCIIAKRGPKWQLVRTALNEGVPEWRDEYDYVWIPDDDLKWETGDVVTMVRTARAFDFALSQPSLVDENITSGAYRGVVTRPATQARCLAHRTNFVEIMCPLFQVQALARVFADTIDHDDVLSGWGLDSVWPGMLRARAIGVVDTVRVVHTRPSNSFRTPGGYQGGADPRLEEYNLMAKHRVNVYVKRVLEVFTE